MAIRSLTFTNHEIDTHRSRQTDIETNRLQEHHWISTESDSQQIKDGRHSKHELENLSLDFLINNSNKKDFDIFP